VHVKGAHLAGGRHIVLKVATGFYRNRARGLPSGDGMFLLLDADTGVRAVCCWKSTVPHRTSARRRRWP